jgi:hypothetical protein
MIVPFMSNFLYFEQHPDPITTKNKIQFFSGSTITSFFQNNNLSKPLFNYIKVVRIYATLRK